jgi:hypothetical protein
MTYPNRPADALPAPLSALLEPAESVEGAP